MHPIIHCPRSIEHGPIPCYLPPLARTETHQLELGSEGIGTYLSLIAMGPCRLACENPIQGLHVPPLLYNGVFFFNIVFF